MSHTVLTDEILGRLLRSVSPEPNTGCWLWMGELTGHGYGRCYINGKRHRTHRVFYEHAFGAITEELELDHTCRVRSCCNPAHLRPASRASNAHARRSAQTHCKHGHEYTPTNTYTDPRGWRQCLTCRERWWSESKAGISPAPNKTLTHCHRGHAFTPKNTRVDNLGRRYCRACATTRQKIDQSRF